MAETHVLAALKRRYAVTLGQGGQADDLAHLAAVIRMFAPGEDVAAIKPVRPYSKRRDGNGAVWLREAFRVLRTANAPMSAREIAARVMAARGIEPDARTAASVECSLLATLGKRVGADVVRVEGRPMRWALKGREP
jgi:hypothetical protein